MAGNSLMTTRRQILVGIGATLATGASARAEPVMTDDGFYRESWFIESFLDMPADLAAAHLHGKHFAVMWELRGCPYCRDTHLINFARPDIAVFVRDRFDILQLNVLGSLKVTDFDGEVLTEKQLAAKYGVHFTPTIQFFEGTAESLKQHSGQQREAIRIPGYLRPDDFLDVFRYVAQKGDSGKTFREFLESKRSAG
jgi:thioredoxin-related protein